MPAVQLVLAERRRHALDGLLVRSNCTGSAP